MGHSHSPKVRCIAWNVQSLVNKVYDVISVMSDNDIDLAFISETWFSTESNMSISILKEAGYSIVHYFRSYKRGAGVAIIWNDRVNKQIRSSTAVKSFDTFQYQNLNFLSEFNTNLICLYRLQETSTEIFMQELNSLLSEQDPRHPLLLTGDFNFHFEKSDLNAVKELSDLTSSFGLSQFVVGPSNKFGHTLDLLFANSYEFDLNPIQPVDYGLSDHFPIFFEFPNISKTTTTKKRVVTCRDTKSLNVPSFASHLATSLHSSLDEVSEHATFCELLGVYNATVTSVFDHHAPAQSRTFTMAAESPPWLDREYKSSRAIRRRLERQWKKSGLGSDKKAYVSQRELCASMSKQKRIEYYHNLIESKRGDQRALFNTVNTIFGKNKSQKVLPNHDNSKELADRFNCFYLNKVKQLRMKIPPNQTNGRNSTFGGTTMDCLRPTTVQELRKILNESGIKTSFNDILPASILKQVIEELLPHLCELVNKSLSTGSVEGLKESIVVPLLKKVGLDADILKNYRPVADLVFLSKLSERVVAKRFDEHMCMNKLQSKYEHGYKKFHSTETLLLPLINEVLSAFDNNLATILLLIDLSAAFDTVDIDLLLHILETELGITGIALDWFQSFLKGRNQRVIIENTLSDSLKVDFGVPQGSVLGPVLFNVYIRSLYEIIESHGFGTSGYADDNNASQSFALHFQYDVINFQLPALMDKIKIWMHSHFLKINPDKTEIIVFLPNSLKEKSTINGAFLDGDCIRFSHVVKNLGFKLDRLLSMESQVNSIVSHCYKLIGDVARIRDLLSDTDAVSLMHAIVSSRVDYCNSLFCGIENKLISKLQKVQNAAARLISKRRKHESVRDVLKELHWLPVQQRIIFKVLLLTFKILNGMAPENLSSLISVRHADALILNNVYFNSVNGRRTFAYIAPRYWNALPLHVRSSRSIDVFKRSTKSILFQNFETLQNAAFMYH